MNTVIGKVQSRFKESSNWVDFAKQNDMEIEWIRDGSRERRKDLKGKILPNSLIVDKILKGLNSFLWLKAYLRRC